MLLPKSVVSPITIREGEILSLNASPSLRNSGENIILLERSLSFNSLVKPTGVVDFINIGIF